MYKQTPPMGWNSWNTFGHDINEQLIRETADAMVERGLLAAGYEYVVIDDCWALRERDKDGHMVADPKKFPSGMKALADYVHSKGLKFGMYSCDGTRTCAGYPGSYGYEFIDAFDFAEIGIDYLKYDNCYKPTHMPGKLLYNRMSMALKATGRDILFSVCNWGNEDVETWIRSTGAGLYRSTGDIFDGFKSLHDIYISQLDKFGYIGPGCFNDVDMLLCGMKGVGNVGEGNGFSGCTDEQYDMHFALWCFMASPLMIGCDVRTVDEKTITLLTNRELIAIDQDFEVRPPYVLENWPNTLVMMRHLSNNEYLFGIFNIDDNDREFVVDFSQAGLEPNCGYGFEFTDLFTGENCGIITSGTKMENLKGYHYHLYRAKVVKA